MFATAEAAEPRPTGSERSESPRASFVVVANRLPVHRFRRTSSNATTSSDTTTTWRTSPGGLVSALQPILRNRASCWIGWPGVADLDTAPFRHDGIANVPLSCSRAEVAGFYDGFSNRTLWPLYHDAIREPEFRRSWWRTYVDVNRRFAEAALSRAADDAFIWIQDYHLQLVPSIIRDRGTTSRIGFFLHIPFPPPELFSRLPWRRQILEGLLGADVIGFQTKTAARNFMKLARRYTNARGTGIHLEYEGRTIRVDAFPISIDFAHIRSLAREESVVKRALRFRGRLDPSRKVLLGVDRLDYTKGIDVRLKAYRDLLRAGHVNAKHFVLVQVAVPSRERVSDYKRLRSQIERLVGEINGEFGELGRAAVHYLHRSFDVDALVSLYRAADVMLVTPFVDGMNLVAKEFVAARDDERGVLVLSEFAGAAQELGAALLVNPYDVDGVALAIQHALGMSNHDQRSRMRSMRRSVQKNDVFAWTRRFLEAAQE